MTHDARAVPPRVPRPAAVWGHVLTLLLALPASATAQDFLGSVFDGETSEPLTGAALTLLDPDGQAIAPTALSGPEGEFTLEVPGPGEYYLRIELEGYRTLTDGPFDFDRRDARLEVEVFLRTPPIELEGIEATVDQPRTERLLRMTGFYDRQKEGFGYHIDPAEIEARGYVPKFSNYLRKVPGVGTRGDIVLFRTRDPNVSLSEDREKIWMCEPNVFMDGVLLAKAVMSSREIRPDDYWQGLDGRIETENVLAIEVYNGPASTPLQWGGGNGSCGTIVIWTKS